MTMEKFQPLESVYLMEKLVIFQPVILVFKGGYSSPKKPKGWSLKIGWALEVRDVWLQALPPRKLTLTMEKSTIEDVFPVEHGYFPMSCLFSGV